MPGTLSCFFQKSFDPYNIIVLLQAQFFSSAYWVWNINLQNNFSHIFKHHRYPVPQIRKILLSPLRSVRQTDTLKVSTVFTPAFCLEILSKPNCKMMKTKRRDVTLLSLGGRDESAGLPMWLDSARQGTKEERAAQKGVHGSLHGHSPRFLIVRGQWETSWGPAENELKSWTGLPGVV